MPYKTISIHALREEGDRLDNRVSHRPLVISIHALREEGDPSLVNSNLDLFLFLSTPSARRATIPPQATGGILIFLSTPSARRATLAELQNIMMRAISIHALREEGDKSLLATASFGCSFLSTPSARRATY